MAANEVDPHYYLTLDNADENLVLELVWVQGDKMFTRHGGTWIPINPDADNARIWDVQIIDVTEEAAQELDAAELQGPLTRDIFEDYEILEEEPA